jgi:lysophospholipase L1-like esterase
VCSPTHAAGPAAHRGAEYANGGSRFADFAAARALWRRRSQQAPTAGDDGAGPFTWRSALFRGSRGDAEAQTHAARGVCGSTSGGGVRCIVLGDSLVSGVGSDVSGSPALPQRFAAALAERLGAQVTWRALGKTGADVAAMRSALLPHLRAEAAAAPDAAPTVLLLLCGLNDFKRAHRGATSSAFHAELSALVAEVRDICGPHTLVVLPALPLAATARFPVPLHWLVCALGARYDEQKRKLALRFARSGRVLFVDAPALPAAAEVPALLSGDGVHPNDAGYGLWGAHIAEAVATHLRARGDS